MRLSTPWGRAWWEIWLVFTGPSVRPPLKGARLSDFSSLRRKSSRDAGPCIVTCRIFTHLNHPLVLVLFRTVHRAIYYVELSGATIFLDGFSGLFLSSASQEHWYKTCTGYFLSNPPFPSHRVHLPHVPHCRVMRPFFWHQIRSINHTLKCPRLVLIRETWNLLSQYGPSQHPAACALSLLVIGWLLSVGLYRILRSKMDAFRKLCSFWSKSLRSRLTFTLLSGGVFAGHTTSVKNNNRLGADPFVLFFFSSFFLVKC